MYEQYHEVFEKAGLSEGIDIDAFDASLANAGPMVKTYAKGQEVTSFKDLSYIGLVLSGTLAGVESRSNGDQDIFYLLHPGDLLGTTIVFSDWIPGRSRTIKARTDAQVMWIPVAFFTSPTPVTGISMLQVQKNINKILARRTTRLYQDLSYARARSTREKVSRYLYDRAHDEGSNTFTLEMNREELADYFAIPRQSLSRTLAKMRDEGIVEFERSRFAIKDMDLLQAYI